MDEYSLDEMEIAKSLCRDSFFHFLKEYWSTFIPEPMVLNWHIKYLCDELQFVAERVFQGLPKKHDLIINISPGSTKSSIASVAFPAWNLTRMKTTRNICGSFTQPLALDLGRKSRDIVLSEKFKAMYPEITIRPDQNSKGHWAIIGGGARYSCTVGGSVTGMHGHFLIVDDPMDPKGSRSDEEIATANTWMSETLPSRKVDKRVSVTILIMQRLNQNDPTGHILEKNKGNIRKICLPAEETPDICPPELKKYYVGGLMDPVRLNREVLAEAKTDLGTYGYAGQYLQSPIPIGGGMFLTDKLVIGHMPPAFWKRIVRYWDKAGSHGKGAFTVGVKMGLDLQGNIWVLDVVRGQWGTHDRERKIKETADRDGAGVLIGVEQEPGSAGLESAENTIKRLMGYRVIKDPATGDKVLRADPFSTQVNAGVVRLAPGGWNKEYVEEMKYFPASRYKDQIDGSSGAFKLLSKVRYVAGAL